MAKLGQTLSQPSESGEPISSQQEAHRKLILQQLQGKTVSQMKSFQAATKEHAEHAKQRQRRVVKYGTGTIETRISSSSFAGETSKGDTKSGNSSNAVSGSNGNGIGSGNNSGNGAERRYAMFADPTSRHTELRRRSGAPNSVGGTSSFAHQPSQQKYAQPQPQCHQHHEQQQQQTKQTAPRNKLYSAEKVEASIAQMGELFSQMSNLVLQQGETITRIEDDVEAGHADMTEGRKSMEELWTYTKGNRGVILKIFGLLVFFIFVFLVWS
jgi:hypothetical protein